MARATAAAIVLGTVLAACGSSSPVGFHSATKTYSVHEVELAFSEHGVPLVKAERQRLPGVTALAHGRGSSAVSVQVTGGGTLYETLWGKGPRPQQARNGNVYVSFPAADAAAVHAALAELH